MATLKDVKRIVIKVGTSTLTHHTGKSNIRQIKKLVAVISDIVNSGVEVALVTSGAIGVGVGKLGLRDRPTNTAGKQAAATIDVYKRQIMIRLFLLDISLLRDIVKVFRRHIS